MTLYQIQFFNKWIFTFIRRILRYVPNLWIHVRIHFIVDFPTNISVQMLIKNIHSLDELHMVSIFNQICSKNKQQTQNKNQNKTK